MSLFRQALLLFGICLVGAALEAVLPFPMSASVLAMLLVLALLLARALKERQLGGVCDLLQRHMMFFFIPASVGILEQLDILRSHGVLIVLLCIAGTLVTFTVCAGVTTVLIKLQNKGGTP